MSRRADNYITFHDLTPEGRILWASPSVYDVLGYDPDELVGVVGYDIVLPADHEEGREFHRENFFNDLVASQIVVRYKAKDGQPVHCVSVISMCYDFVINSTTMLDTGGEAYLQRRVHSSAVNRRVGSKKEEFERLKRHHEAFATDLWDHKSMEPEARVCLILNRFTRNFVIMYASSACEKVFHLDPDDIIGKPVLLYIRADDLGPFVEQVDLIKTTTAIAQMRFWFQSPNCRDEIPCEAVIFGAADGIVAVVRKCKPFIRKRFISAGFEEGSPESSWSYGLARSYGSSASQWSPSPSPPTRGGHGYTSTSPPRRVPRATLNRIKIFDLEDKKDNSNLVDESRATWEVPAFKEVLVQDYRDDDDDDDDDNDDIGTGVRDMAIGNSDGARF
ncbi:hypothetical protein B0O80DRAFT_496245 [Mortierella sp. GBAus27b]|nr:hypothetical protein B0O80DRAFT_496245 [Mortierella sp. GBAus27b]